MYCLPRRAATDRCCALEHPPLWSRLLWTYEYFSAQTAEIEIRADIPNGPVDCGLFAVNPASIRYETVSIGNPGDAWGIPYSRARPPPPPVAMLRFGISGLMPEAGTQIRHLFLSPPLPTPPHPLLQKTCLYVRHPTGRAPTTCREKSAA